MKNTREINVGCLIISHLIDYSTDLICLELKKRGVNYLRLNRDSLSKYRIEIKFNPCRMVVYLNDDLKFIISDQFLNSIYYRAPVFLRSYKIFSLEEQVYRSQWSAFIRNLIIFENILWVNNPVATYKAENKIYQLKIAQMVGLTIPPTIISNHVPKKDNLNSNDVAIKSIDTALFYDGMNEIFSYTQRVAYDELCNEQLSLAPVMIQDFLYPKIDLRVTVIGNNIYPVEILSNGNGVKGDWRREKKDDLSFIPTKLPDSINRSILLLMDKLNLNIAGIDLILSKGTYFFIEINPTGEWGWLTRTALLPLDKQIASLLCAST